MADHPSFDDELRVAERLARQAGQLLLDRRHDERVIEHKGVIDLVTDADHASESLIIDGLREAFPDDAVLAEESGQLDGFGHDRRRWVIDPLDGTTNYAHLFPLYAVSIALVIEDSPAVGVVHAPALDETYTATATQEARLNGDRIQVSETDQLEQAMLATGFPYNPETRHENLPLLTEFLRSSQAVRRAGAAAYDLCCVAAGRFDGYWEREVSAWDIAAGVLIVEQAGGVVSDYGGGSLQLYEGEILASNAKLHAPLVTTIEDVLRQQ